MRELVLVFGEFQIYCVLIGTIPFKVLVAATLNPALLHTTVLISVICGAGYKVTVTVKVLLAQDPVGGIAVTI